MPNHRQEESDICITIVCDGLHPADIEELQRSLSNSRYKFSVDRDDQVRTEIHPVLSVIGIRTKLIVRFTPKWFYGRTRRRGMNALISAIDDAISNSPHDRDFRPRLSNEGLITFEKWLRPRTKKHSWIGEHQLTVGSLILTGIAAVAAVLVVPEFRRFFHLDNPETIQQIQPDKRTSIPSVPQPSTVPGQSSEPSKSGEASNLKKARPQKTTTQVKGNDNVAGNSVSGDHNVIGNNNNNQTAPTVNAQNGIAILGGTVTSPTVNNYVPQARHLNDEQKATLSSCLKPIPGRYFIAAVSLTEAYDYAKDFADAFSSAGWSNTQSSPVATMMAAEPVRGVQISMHGTFDPATQRSDIIEGSPESLMVPCMNGARIHSKGLLDKKWKTGVVQVVVGEATQ
jgi:hypothetical protein